MEDPSNKLLSQWRMGDEQAADKLIGRYADRLVALVQSRLPSHLASRIDSEDVVQSVYRSFFATAREGRYEAEHGGDLWQVLVVITLHKLYDHVRHNHAGKRDAGREHHFGSEDSLFGIQAHLQAREPSPLEAATLAEQLEQIMNRLEPLPRHALELRLQGHTLDEIADQLHCSQRSVRRMLETIRQLMIDSQGPPNP